MILDTSFIIDLLGGAQRALVLAEDVDRSGEPLRLPSPAVFELWVGAGKALRPEEETARVESLALAYGVVPFNGEDARRAGALQALLFTEGRSLGTVDVQIAGMCLARGETLLTGDRRLAGVGHGLSVRTYPQR